MIERNQTGESAVENNGRRMTFGLPQAIIVTVLSIAIAASVAIANS